MFMVGANVGIILKLALPRANAATDSSSVFGIAGSVFIGGVLLVSLDRFIVLETAAAAASRDTGFLRGAGITAGTGRWGPVKVCSALIRATAIGLVGRGAENGSERA